MNRQQKTWAFGILLSVFIALTACDDRPSLTSFNEDKPEGDYSLRKQIESMRGIQGTLEAPVIEVTTGTIIDELSVKGTLVPRKSVIVKPLMDGRITFLRPIKVGDLVEKDEMIAKIDDRDIEDEIKNQLQQIDITSASLQLDERILSQSEKDLEYDREMLAKGLLTEIKVREAETNLEQAKINLQRNRITLEQEKNRLQQSLRKREKVAIKAPMSGMVVLSSHLTGQKNAADFFNEEIMAIDDTLVGTGTNLFGIISQDAYLAQCQVNGSDKAKVRLGQNAQITIISHKELTVPGTVTEIAHLQDTKSHAYKVWIRLSAVDPSFTTGLFVRAAIELDRSEGAIIIPSKYIRERGERKIVQIVQDDQIAESAVQTGIAYRGAVEIVEGLKAGDWLLAMETEMALGQRVAPQIIEVNETD